MSQAWQVVMQRGKWQMASFQEGCRKQLWDKSQQRPSGGYCVFKAWSPCCPCLQEHRKVVTRPGVVAEGPCALCFVHVVGRTLPYVPTYSHQTLEQEQEQQKHSTFEPKRQAPFLPCPSSQLPLLTRFSIMCSVKVKFWRVQSIITELVLKGEFGVKRQ